jgi:protein-disulfide isomerase
LWGTVLRVLLRQTAIVAGIAIAIVAAVVVAVVVASGASSNKGPLRRGGTPGLNSASAKAAGAGVRSSLAGIPQHGSTLGDPRAPVTLQYFGDLECPFCKQFALGALPALIQHYVRSGKLKIEYRSLETATRDPETFKNQQVAALAAGKQNHMWEYIELFYRYEGRENSGYVTERYLQGLAHQVPGLNPVAWTAARSRADLASTLASDARAASSAGLSATPSFLIGRTGGPLLKLTETSLTNPLFYALVIERLLRGGVPSRLAIPS